MKKYEIKPILENKAIAIEKILSLVDGEQYKRLKHYSIELKDLLKILDLCEDKDFFLVGKEILEKRTKTADVAIVEEEGYYYKIVLVKTFPYPDLYMINISSLEEVI